MLRIDENGQGLYGSRPHGYILVLTLDHTMTSAARTIILIELAEKAICDDCIQQLIDDLSQVQRALLDHRHPRLQDGIRVVNLEGKCSMCGRYRAVGKALLQ